MFIDSVFQTKCMKLPPDFKKRVFKSKLPYWQPFPLQLLWEQSSIPGLGREIMCASLTTTYNMYGSERSTVQPDRLLFKFLTPQQTLSIQETCCGSLSCVLKGVHYLKVHITFIL